MPHHRQSPFAARNALAVAALLAVAACGGADTTGPGGGGGSGGSVGFSKSDLFVSATTGSDANAGTRQKPVATIGRALALAGDTGTIRVAGGAYLEQVRLRSRIDIVGGYDPSSWKRDTAAYHTMIGDTAMAVSGYGVDSVVLDGLYLSTLVSSRYAVVYLDSSVGIHIRGSTISAARGSNGGNNTGWGYVADSGTYGIPGTPARGCPPSVTGGAGGHGPLGGANGGDGGTGGLLGGFDGGTGKGTGGGSGGKGGAAFTVGGTGKAPSAVGATGADGAGGVGFGSFSLTFGYGPAWGDNGQQGGGGPGGGGGGGGGGIFVLGICGGGGGGGGQGGMGGQGGGPGQGGAASIGVILSTTSELVMDTSVVVTGGGGIGGAGAAGQLGGYGGPGGAGGVGTAGAGAGGKGGAGGRGGQGGWGGGGGGGPSIGILVLDNGRFTGNGVAFRLGPGGAGGASGSSAASVGTQGDTARIMVVTPTP